MSPSLKQWRWNAIFLIALCAPMALVWSLAVFPSQDGPVHLYYVDVLRALLTHSHQYGSYFEIRALLTPYTFHYYTLVVLETVFSAVTSEKILLCLYIGLFGFAFKYLVESVTAPGTAWPLLAIPFCLNRLVYMGFFNYSFGVALTLFMAGYWLRSQERFDARRIAGLFAGLVVLLLTHPIPVAVLLLFMGIHLLIEVLRATSGVVSALRLHARKLAALAAMGALAGIWVLRFIGHPQGPEIDADSAIGFRHWINLEWKLWPLVPLTTRAYRWGLIALLAAAAITLLLAVARQRRIAISSRAMALASASFLCFLLFALMPEWVGGGAFVRERFPIFFVLFLLAAAAAAAPAIRWSYAPGVIALAVLCLTLGLQYRRAEPMAADLQRLLLADPSQPSTAGMLLQGKSPLELDLNFDPYYWAGAHYFRRSHAILLNAPWLDVPIYMLRPSQPAPWNYLDPQPETAYVSSHAGCGSPRLDFAVLVGSEVPHGVDSAIRGHCLVPAARAGQRVTIYTRNSLTAACCPQTTNAAY